MAGMMVAESQMEREIYHRGDAAGSTTPEN
jgi:hypothetical protein